MHIPFNEKAITLDGVHTRSDYFEIDGVTYQALPLNENDHKIGKGVNSTVFRAKKAEDVDSEPVILKICNYFLSRASNQKIGRVKRFDREIEAMKRVLQKKLTSRVVKILGDATVEVKKLGPNGQSSTNKHRCFLMEAATSDLASYLRKERDISFQQRLQLCFELTQALIDLHSIEIYHRDIKPENILLFDGIWKIADLGLISFRGEDADFDREKIGPYPWMSPEAFNKAFYLDREDNGFINCKLDEKSDLFQLGKLCWYILQGDVPNGCLTSMDFKVGNNELFGNILKPMLFYNNFARPSLEEIKDRFQPILRRHGL